MCWSCTHIPPYPEMWVSRHFPSVQDQMILVTVSLVGHDNGLLLKGSSFLSPTAPVGEMGLS